MLVTGFRGISPLGDDVDPAKGDLNSGGMMRTTLAVLAAVLSTHSATADTPAHELRFLLVTPFVDYTFFAPVKKGMQDAAKSMGVQAVFDGTKNGDVKSLAAKVTQAVQDGYDGIALNIVDPVAFDGVIVEAMRNGVPVIAFNVDDSRTPNARLAAVGQNMLAAGRAFGLEIAAAVPDKSQLLITMHDPNISALEDRSSGIKEVLMSRGVSWIELITGTDREQAITKIRAALAANPAIKIIVGTGSADTEAAGLAIERYLSGQGYASAGFDLSPDILRLVKAGVIRFTIDQQPYLQGYLSVVNLTLYKRYGLKPSTIDTGATIITADQVERIVELSQRNYR